MSKSKRTRSGPARQIPQRKASTGKNPEPRATVSGPARPSTDVDSSDDLSAKAAGTQALAAAFPFNANKPHEYDPDAALHPDSRRSGRSRDDPIVGASTVQRGQRLRQGRQRRAADRRQQDHRAARSRARRFDRPRADDQPGRAGRRQPELAQGRPARADAARGLHPAREDHALRSRAHPRAHRARARLGRARLLRVLRAARPTSRAPSLFAEAGKRTPVFVRFSTVAGERGSTDTARDVRGFAVKFYTDEGNWDLVGNNIPVFFIQDAMKFPDLVHAVEARAALTRCRRRRRAHDTFWDFVSLMPEINAHADVGDVGPRDPAQLPDDAGLRRAHLPPGQRRGRVALRQVPLERRAPARTRWSGTRR